MILTCPSCKAQNRVPAPRLGDRARCGACKAAVSPPSSPVVVSSPAEFEELVAGSPLPVLVDFWAAWCGPCRMVAPELEKLAREKAGSLLVAKLDTESVPAVAGRFGIRSIPTMILFRGGNEQKRVMGAMPRDAIARELGV